VDDHGSEIDVSTEQGKETTITVAFPALLNT
jgi:hypothetical protein